jgi:hypothetical protein
MRGVLKVNRLWEVVEEVANGGTAKPRVIFITHKDKP